MSDETTKVPDLPCPKCGSNDVRITYQEPTSVYRGEHQRCRDYASDLGSDVMREHFHRNCQRCHHWWPTVDVLSQ